MRSSYYSDRRFKRSSLAHELCSKIEVTPGPGLRSQRELPPNLYFSFIPSHCLPLLFARSPILIPSRLRPSSFPANAMIPSLSIAPTRPWYLVESSLLAFVSTIYFLFASGEIGRSVGRSASPWSSSSFFHLSLFRLAPKRCPSTASWLPTSRHNRSPREFVDYNKCVCSSRRYRTSSGSPVFFFFLFFPSSLSVVFFTSLLPGPCVSLSSPVSLFSSPLGARSFSFLFLLPCASRVQQGLPIYAARKNDGTDGMK